MRRLRSFDIENIYRIIPTKDVRNIINEILNSNNVKEIAKEEILNLLNVILEQNYIQINEQYYLQNEGLAMGAPTSTLLSEVYRQHLQHISIADILNKHKIIDYYRYMDDILIVYDERKTNIINMLENFNAIHTKLKFTIEQQTQNRINYLGLTIKKNRHKLNFEIYRKPTTIDLILHNTSCHPYEHKKLAIIYLYNRLNT
jgi:hypothetical protein